MRNSGSRSVSVMKALIPAVKAVQISFASDEYAALLDYLALVENSEAEEAIAGAAL